MVIMAEDTSRSIALGPVGIALLHKFPSQQLIGLTHETLYMQLLVTVPLVVRLKHRSIPAGQVKTSEQE